MLSCFLIMDNGEVLQWCRGNGSICIKHNLHRSRTLQIPLRKIHALDIRLHCPKNALLLVKKYHLKTSEWLETVSFINMLLWMQCNILNCTYTKTLAFAVSAFAERLLQTDFHRHNSNTVSPLIQHLWITPLPNSFTTTDSARDVKFPL